MCQCCIGQNSVYLISYLHQKIERICILSNTKANYRPHIPLHNFSKWIRNDNGNCCKKASKIELHGRFMATKNPLQSFLAQPWNNNVMLPLPFFVNQQKICFNRHRTLNTLVGIDQVLDTFGWKEVLRKKKQNALTALFSSRHYSIYILFFCFISLSNLFEKQKQVLLSL